MKLLISAFIMTLSLNTFAASFVASTLLPTESLAVSSLSTSADSARKEAAQLINDSQEFNQSGTVSLLLAEKVSAIQAQDNTVSIQEAVDALVSVSVKILN